MNEQERRFENIEKDIKEIKEEIKSEVKSEISKIKEDIVDMKQDQAETRIYVKQIFERIDDLKVLFKTGTNANNKTWSNIVMELIKYSGIIAGIIAGIKILG